MPPTIPLANSLSALERPVPAPNALITSATRLPALAINVSVLLINSSPSPLIRPTAFNNLPAPSFISAPVPVRIPAPWLIVSHCVSITSLFKEAALASSN